MNCPKCGTEVDIKKYKLLDCQCGAKLLVVQVAKKLIIEDVTPELEEFKRGKSIE